MISTNMKEILGRGSIIRSMFEEGIRLSKIYGEDNVFDFSLGNPSVKPPDAIKNAAIEILQNEAPNMVHGYMKNAGFDDVREAIAKNINEKHNLGLTSKNIVMTVGAACGLCIIFRTILNPEDEVITFTPFFSEYRHYIERNGGKLITAPSIIGSFQPDLEKLEAAITPKTKAVIINSPNNPTGVVYKEEILKKLAKLLERKSNEIGSQIYLVSDEPYRELVYSVDTIVPNVLKLYKNAFVVYSYSKSFSLPGERIGYVAFQNEMDDADEVMLGLCMAIRALGYVNAPSLFQRVIGKCLDVPVDVSQYKENMELLYSHLTSIGFCCVKPEGAFYLFIKSPIEDDDTFVEIAKKYNILVVPGSFFGCPGYFRVAYCVSYETIRNSLPYWSKLAKQCWENHSQDK